MSTESALTLTRHWQVNTRPTSLAEYRDACRSEQVEGFPSVPDAALPHLRVHLVGHAKKDRDNRITWHHRDGGAWAAVLDLHHADNDQAAVELARFLRWCEARGQHSDHTMWALVAALSASGGPTPAVRDRLEETP